MQIKMRKILAILSVMAMLCTLLPLGVFTVSAATTNLVVNGDFETGDYTGWTKNGMTPTVSAEAAHNGGYGVHLYGTNAWASFNQYINLEPATTYHISFWYKSASDAVTSVGVEVKTKNDAGSYNDKTVFLTSGGKSLSASKSTTTWTHVQSVFTTKDSGDMSHLLTFYRGNGTADTTTPSSVYLDDIVLTKLGSGSSNMLQNGGFESTLDPWTQYTSSSQSMALSTDAHTGTNSVIVPFVARSLTVSQVVTVEPNTDYVVTYYYKSLDSNSSTAKNILFGAYGLDAANNGSGVGDLAGAASTLQIANTAWTQGAYVFNSGSNTEVRLSFSGSSSTNPSNRKAMLVDDVVMSKVGADAGDEPETPDEPEVPDEPVNGEASNDGYIINGNFESTDLSNWKVGNGSVSGALAYTGNNSLYSDTNATAYGYTASYYPVVEQNTDYTVTFWYSYVSDASKTMRLYVHDGADNGTTNIKAANNNVQPVVYCNDSSAVAGVWKQATITFNSGANESLLLKFGGGSSGYNAVYIDDVVMTKVGGDEPETPAGLIVNGDFETGSKDPWASGSSSAAITVNSTHKHGGSYGAMVPARNRTFTARQDVTVKADTNYTVTFWYKSTDATQETHLLFGVYATDATASNAAPLATQVVLDNTKSDWTKATYVFNSGSKTSVRVAFGSDNSNCLITNYMYVDDIVMVEGGEISDEPETYVGQYPQNMTSGADIRFMTYNVLVGEDTTNGGYDWGQPITGRPEKACAMINYYKPDVIALEEFSGEWYDYFRANMTDYAFGEMSSKDSQNNGKLYTCIAYNVNTVRLLKTELFRNTVSRWGTQGMRYVNVGFFEVIATGEQFIAAATHPDAGDLVGTSDVNNDGVAGEGDGYWRPQQLEEAAAYVAELSETNKLPVVWGGDFNSGLEGTYDDNVSWYKVADAGFTDATAGRYIDHIFYNGMATHLFETTVNDAAVSGASDHKAVFADIQFLDEYATPIKNVKDNIKTQGRTVLKDGALWLDNSASGIEFSANCEGKVALNLNVKSIKNTDATYGGIYFTVIVDGVKKDRAQCRITSTGNVELVLAENLNPGNHTFEVYRQTEQRGGEIGISSIVMNGTMNEKPEDNRLYIEFIGDSISTGYGALGSVGNDDHNNNASSPLFQDATIAYPYLTAKALGADFSDVCNSGIGAKYGYEGFTMQTFYPLQRYHYDKNTQYNFNTRQPDVVVIALGTNDIAKAPDEASRLAGYQELLDLVRAKNPNSKIVWIYGMMKDDDNAAIASLIEENGGAAEGLYSCELTTNGSGAGWHPSAAAQQVFADELVAFLNSDVLVRYVADEETDKYDVMDSIGTSRMEMTSNKLGLAFGFKIKAKGIEVVNGTEADLTNATIDAFDDGGEYKLLSMGAIVTNDITYGMADMKLDDVDGKKVLDINAKYLNDLEADAAQFAVRITNIPLANEDTIIYARAYYTFEYEGRVITVYDDIQSANYINKYDSNDGVLEW